MAERKVPGDRLVLGLISAFRLLVVHLSEKGLIDQDEYISLIQQVASAHREAGDPHNLADALHALSIHLLGSPGQRHD